MGFTNFRAVFRNFHITKDIYNGLQKTIPTAGLTDQLTCRTTASLLHLGNVQPTSCRNLHTKCHGLIGTEPVVQQQKRHVRKLYPNPFEQDPYFYQHQEEEGELDIHHVPALNNNGPELIAKVQEAIRGDNMGRLFCVVHIGGEQRKITAEDLVLVKGFFPPQIGDKIRLEKVMLLGSKDFTLVGRPLLDRDLVKIEATVIEKTLSHVRVNFDYKKRFRRLKLHQTPHTVLLINSIQVNPAALS